MTEEQLTGEQLAEEQAPMEEEAPPPTASSEPPGTGGEPSTDPEPDILEEMPDPSVDLAAHMLHVNVRFWAELGRARLPLAEAVALGTGAIVDLDKEPDEALDVFVNGTPFARATLLLVDGEWAVRLEEILASPGAVEQASSSGSEA